MIEHWTLVSPTKNYENFNELDIFFQAKYSKKQKEMETVRDPNVDPTDQISPWFSCIRN